MALSTGQAVSGTQFADAMKTFYLSPLNDQIYRATVLLNRLEKNSIDVQGNFAYVPLIAARNPGVGSRKDTDGAGPTLPAIGSQTYDTTTFRMAYHYGRGGVTGPVMRASKSEAGAFAKALDVEMKGLTARLPEDLNRQLWSYGHGRAATLASTQATSTVIEVDSKSIFQCKVGDRVHFDDITAGGAITPTSAITINAITLDQDKNGNSSTTKHKVTLSATSGTSLTIDEDAMYYGNPLSASAKVDSSRNQEMYGIPALVDDGNVGADEGLGGATTPAESGEMLDGSLNFGKIDRTAAANAFWKAQVLQNPNGAGTNRALTVALMEQGFLTALTSGGSSETNLEYYTSPGLWATFGLLHIGDRVFNDFKETFEGGWIALMFNNRPLFYDRDAPRDMIWVIDMSTVMLLTQSGYELMDDDGSVLSRVSGKDAYEFTLYRDIQLGSRNNSKNVLIDDCKATFQIQATT